MEEPKKRKGVYCSACSVCSHQKLRYTHFLKFGNYLLIQDGGERMALEDALFPLLFWGSPIGLGIFFAGLGYLVRASAYVARKSEKTED